MNTTHLILATLLAVSPLALHASESARTAAATVAGSEPTTGTIRAVERMPELPELLELPEPLDIRDWSAVSRAYYQKILNPAMGGPGWPAVHLDSSPGFRMKSYLGDEAAEEAMTCLSAVVGARLAGLDPRAIHGRDWLAACDAWFDPTHGQFRHTRQDRSPAIHADIYGYFPSVLGLILAAQFPENAGLQAKADAVAATFHTIARGLGCPDRPDFDVLGWDLAAGEPGGREEPMNRLGHAPTVAWVLAIGAERGGGNAMRDCARAALQWQIDHPGRYEVTHLMFYEGLKSWDPAPERRFQPYATGDPVLLGWGGRAQTDPARYHQEKQARFADIPDNLSLYMGNHVGFLGGIVATTEVPGVLLWDCRKTDWFHAPAWPAFLAFNPHPNEREITMETGPAPVAVFDLVSGVELRASVTGRHSIRLPGDTARVLVMHPARANRETRDGMIFAGDRMLGGDVRPQSRNAPDERRQ